MAAIGSVTPQAQKRDALARSRARAALIPELLVDARRIANTVISGWHGRRKRGIGETFWQYRPYREGETMARIDWRRSARDDETYVRDLEWEAAHTAWIWCDQSASMLFKSENARLSKEHRAMVLAFSLAELLSRGGERVGYPGLLRPVVARNGAERLAAALAAAPDTILSETMPQLDMISRYNDLIIISDFLDPPDEVLERLDTIARRGARCHLIEVCDPAEEMFPYRGRTEFRDPETGARLTAGRAEDWSSAYRNINAARRQAIAERCRRLGWSYSISHTDTLASEALVAVYGQMTGQPLGAPSTGKRNGAAA